MEHLILVNESDIAIGKAPKLEVHLKGLLHRAFSVFIFNSKGELLLQQRADDKYHSGGLWTNTCCSHPRFGEELSDAVERRLMEEMGIKCEADFQFSFIYKTEFGNGLKEHEYDHVYFGICDKLPIPDESEVKNWKYVHLHSLGADLINNPDEYTAWLKICFEKILSNYEQFAAKNKIKIHSDSH